MVESFLARTSHSPLAKRIQFLTEMTTRVSQLRQLFVGLLEYQQKVPEQYVVHMGLKKKHQVIKAYLKKEWKMVKRIVTPKIYAYFFFIRNN